MKKDMKLSVAQRTLMNTRLYSVFCEQGICSLEEAAAIGLEQFEKFKGVGRGSLKCLMFLFQQFEIKYDPEKWAYSMPIYEKKIMDLGCGQSNDNREWLIVLAWARKCSLKEISSLFNISPSRVRQIIEKTLYKIERCSIHSLTPDQRERFFAMCEDSKYRRRVDNP